MKGNEVYREAARAAGRFHERDPWEELNVNHYFALEIPGQDEPVYATCLPDQDGIPCLLLVTGKEAAGTAGKLVRPEGPFTEEEVRGSRIISFAMASPKEISPAERTFLKRAGVRTGQGTAVPLLSSCRPSNPPGEALSKAEAELVLYVLNGLDRAIDRNWFSRILVEPWLDLLTVVIEGDPLSPGVTVEFRPRRDRRRPADPVAAIEVPVDVGSLPFHPGTAGMIGEYVVSGTIRSRDDREKSGTPPDIDTTVPPGDGGEPEAWLVTCYRATARSRTVAEKLLEDDLPAAERRLLEGRLKGWPDLVRVTEIHRDEDRLVLERIMGSGGAVVYHDDLPHRLQAGSCLPVRFYAVGGYLFLEQLGPPLAEGELADAFRFLRHQGMELTHDGIRQEPELGDEARRVLKKFGPACLTAVIGKIEYRLEHPVPEKGAFFTLTSHALSTIGEIRCDRSLEYLTGLLDRLLANGIPDDLTDESYADELDDGDNEDGEPGWKYPNLDFYHLLDCLVRQQDERAIPYLERARDRFPEGCLENIICRIALGRVHKKRVEGWLPMEALEIQMPFSGFMAAFKGEEFDPRENLRRQYGEYLDDEQDDDPPCRQGGKPPGDAPAARGREEEK